MKKKATIKGYSYVGQARNAVPPAEPHLRLYYVDTTLSFFILHASGKPRLHYDVTTATALDFLVYICEKRILVMF